MYTFIGIGRLAANALIEILGKEPDRRYVDFETLIKYGMKVVQHLKQQGEEAILLLSEKYQIDMIENYSDLFEIEVQRFGKKILRLQEGVSIDDLCNHFRWTMSMQLIKAFTCDEAVMELHAST